MTEQGERIQASIEEEEYEEETVLMYVGLPLCENVGIFDDPETEVEISGLEGEHPQIRINRVVLQGQHEVNIGSIMIFSDNLQSGSTSTTTATIEKNNPELIGTTINYIRCDLKQIAPDHTNIAQSDEMDVA